MRRTAGYDRRIGITCAIIISVIAFYTLSIGPACQLTKRGLLSVSQLAVIYRPLLWLDFHAHASLQSALTAYAELCGGSEKLTAAREEPVWRRYDVSEFTCRYRKRVRRPEFPGERLRGRSIIFEPGVGLELTGAICESIGPDTWDEVGGRGAIIPDSNNRTLRVLQSRSVHSEIEKYLDELSRIRRNNFPEHDFDLISLIRIHRHSEPDLHWELKSHALVIDRKCDGRWELDGEPVVDEDTLFARLGDLPPESFEMGIYLPIIDDCLPAESFDRIAKFCEKGDIDLFFFNRKSVENKFGPAWPTDTWEVRRTNSIYAERFDRASR